MTRSLGGRRRTEATALPDWTKPQLIQLVDQPPDGPEWLHEIKFDGYRMHARLDRGTVRLLTRTGLDWTRKYLGVAAAIASLPARQAYLDGELCGVRPDGTTSFSLIQNASDTGNGDALVFFLFDLLHLDGESIGTRPLTERKERLRELLSGASTPLQFSDHQIGRGQAFYDHACGLKLEGIVSKRANAPYAPGNRGLWLKVKCLNREEFVVVGWTDPEGSRPWLGALLLAYRGTLRPGWKAGLCRPRRDRHRSCGTRTSVAPPSTAGHGRDAARHPAAARQPVRLAADLEPGALGNRLMEPARTKIFCEEYARAMNCLHAEHNAQRATDEDALSKVERDLARLVQALLDGVPASAVREKMAELEARRDALRSRLAASEGTGVCLHPNMADYYCTQIADLRAALTEDGRHRQAVEIVRKLVDRIELNPVVRNGRKTLSVSLYGRLAGILAMATKAKAPLDESGAPIRVTKLVAGVGFEPTTFRL
jgi:DNA ligase D-like protein (predicted ligase)